MTVLGIDLGTSQAKAMLCGADGTVLGRGAAGYDISTPREGWAETDTADWWRAVLTAVRAALTPLDAATGTADGPVAGPVAEVAVIAVTGQMHGVVLVSAQSVVLRPAITWLDRRATAQAADYRRLGARSLAALGNAPAPGMAGPLLSWLARHEPAVYDAARWQFQPKDWLRFALTGEAATDPTDASGTLLFDLSGGIWAKDVVHGIGLRSDLLPPLGQPDEVAGLLLPGAAAELGLRPGIPVVTGASDTAAALLAARLPAPAAGSAAGSAAGQPAGQVTAQAAGSAAQLSAGPRWALLTLGTGGQWIMPAGAGAGADPAGRTSLFRAADGGLFRLGGAQNVGVTLNWVRGVLGVSWDDLYGSAASAAPSGSLVFWPELVTERADQASSGGNWSGGGWSGARLADGRQDLMRAALAGVAGLLRQRLEDLHAVGCVPEKVLLGGGGSRHPAWRDLLSSELGLPLCPAATPWLTARGATMLAGRAAGYDWAGAGND